MTLNKEKPSGNNYFRYTIIFFNFWTFFLCRNAWFLSFPYLSGIRYHFAKFGTTGSTPQISLWGETGFFFFFFHYEELYYDSDSDSRLRHKTFLRLQRLRHQVGLQSSNHPTVSVHIIRQHRRCKVNSPNSKFRQTKIYIYVYTTVYVQNLINSY